jgi:tetratricopeptide (TPR) repeat protein
MTNRIALANAFAQNPPMLARIVAAAVAAIVPPKGMTAESPGGRLCAGTIEACILGAVAVIPIVYEPSSEMLYQIPKAVVLHGLAFILLGAWCARVLLNIGSRGSVPANWRGSFSLPLLFCVCLAATSLVSTLFSVDPSTSLFGMFQWKQGWLDLCALMLFFLAATGTLRSREQQDRLVTTLLVASLPVSICAILQRYHVSVDSGRAYSTLGWAVFLADYLAPLIPLTLWRLGGLCRSAWRSPDGRTGNAVRALFYLLLAVLQIVTCLLTNSRGSVLSLIAGLLLWAALSFKLKRRRLLSYGFLGLAALFLFSLAISKGSLQSLSPARLLSRVDLLAPSHGKSISYRVVLWKAAADTALSGDPIRCPDDSNDRWQYLRPLIGFGLNTQPFVLLQHLGETGRSPDEVEYYVHNLAWEKWIELGALGSIAFASIPMMVFFLTLKRLGMIKSRMDVRLYWIALVAGGLGGAVAFTLWGGLAFAGVGLPLGLFAGLIVFSVAKQTEEGSDSQKSFSDDPASFMKVTLSAVTICLLCTVSEPATVTTLVNYWVLLGLLLSLASPNAPESSAAATESNGQAEAKHQDEVGTGKATASERQDWRPALVAGLFASVVLVSILQDFIWCEPGATLSVCEYLRKCVFDVQPASGFGVRGWMVILPTWLGASWLLSNEFHGEGRNLPGWTVFAWVALTSGGTALLFAVVRAWQLTNIGPPPNALASPALVVRQAIGYELAFPLYCSAIYGLFLLGGFLISQVDLPSSGLRRNLRIVAFLACFIVVAVAAPFLGGARSVQADVSCHFAQFLQNHGNRPAAIDIYRRAVKLKPDAFYYREQLAYALGTMASLVPDYESFVRWSQERESVLLQAQGSLSVARSARLLGISYLEWAGGERLPVQIQDLALRASRALHRATIFDPRNSVVWMERAIADSVFLGKKEEGLREKENALALAEHQGRETLGGYYLNRGTFEPRCARMRNAEAMAAILYYRDAINDPKTADRESFVSKISTAEAYLVLNEFGKAVGEWQQAITNAPREEIWRSEEFRARLCLSQTNQSLALQHVDSAMSQAPPDAIEDLVMLRNFITVATPR